MRPTQRMSWRTIVASGVAAAAALAAVMPAAAAGPMTVTSPKIPGAAALFGPVVDAGVASDTLATLKTAPDVAVPGKKVTVTGSGLAKAKDVRLVWMTANVRWILDPKADSVDYIGRKVDKIAVALANTQTDAAGAFKATFRVPKDFGGLHDIFAVVDGKQVAKGGFLLERTVKISPTRGPVGTPITVTVVGMGSPTYESVGAVLYDNHYAGRDLGEHDPRRVDLHDPRVRRRRARTGSSSPARATPCPTSTCSSPRSRGRTATG